MLATFVDKMHESIERDGAPIHNRISLGKLNEEERLTYIIIWWCSEINEIIDNLNIVLEDMRTLSETHYAFKGSPQVRFYLLVRTFFYECYRVREVFSQVLHALRLNKKMSKAGVSLIRKEFHEKFSGVINIRNHLVHGFADWKGKESLDLMLVSVGLEIGKAFRDVQTQKIIGIQDALRNIGAAYLPHLHVEGERVRELMQLLINEFVRVSKEQGYILEKK